MSETTPMSDHEKVVAELRAMADSAPFTREGVLRAADLIAHQAARLEEMQAETRRIQAAALVHIDEMAAFQRKMVVMERERDDTKAALTAAEAEVGRLRAALKPLAERVDEIEQVKAVAKFATEGTAAVKLSLLREARACLSSKKEG